jgi:hypothetical protein
MHVAPYAYTELAFTKSSERIRVHVLLIMDHDLPSLTVISLPVTFPFLFRYIR